MSLWSLKLAGFEKENMMDNSMFYLQLESFLVFIIEGIKCCNVEKNTSIISDTNMNTNKYLNRGFDREKEITR